MQINSVNRIINNYLTAIMNLTDNEAFAESVTRASTMVANSDTVHFVGIGKSLVSATKACASLKSLGKKSSIIHATDFMHGDCGGIGQYDTIIFISHSGKTEEVLSAINHAVTVLQIDSCVLITGGGEEIDDLIPYSVSLVKYGPITESSPYAVKYPNVSSLITTLVCEIIVEQYVEFCSEHRITKEFYKNHPGGTIGKLNQGLNQ